MPQVIKSWQAIFLLSFLVICNCVCSWEMSSMGQKRCYWKKGWVETHILLLLQSSQAGMKWQWFKYMLDRPYALQSEMKWCCIAVLLSIRTTTPASRTAGRSPTWKKCILPLSFKSHSEEKPMSIPARHMLEQDVTRKTRLM